jgi:NAD(P)-dependent dehydrogenase (short-subunit alcohol dehydrogenase family)
MKTNASPKTWFITGTSSGFGRIMTEKLLARGDRVAATLRNVEALDDLRAHFGDRLWVSSLEMTDTTAIHQTIDRAFHDLSRVDVLVSNAGYGLVGAAEELREDQIRHQIETNLLGSILLIRAALPHLRAQGGGRIIQVASEGGQITYPAFSIYHATKWGIEGFVDAVAKEVAPFQIEFTIAEPGPARTNFGRGIVRASPLSVYETTSVGQVRQAIASGAFNVRGDPNKMSQAIIDSTDRSPAPRRLTLGAGAYQSIRAELVKRLTELDAQKDVAVASDVDE